MKKGKLIPIFLTIYSIGSFFLSQTKSPHSGHKKGLQQLHTEKKRRDRLLQAPPQPVWKKPCKTYRSMPQITEEKKIVVIVPSYNNSRWYQYNLDSIFSQQYSNYFVIYIDDCSSDGTGKLVENYIQRSKFRDKITLIKNQTNLGALANIYYAVHSCDDKDIVTIVDGDDWLACNNVFSILNKTYDDPNVWLTYGQYEQYPAGKGLCRTIPKSVIENHGFRNYDWTASHLRTFYAGLFKKINQKDLLYEDDFFTMTWDLAIMFPMLEMSGNRFEFINNILYIYNNANVLNDHKKNRKLQVTLGKIIRTRKKYDQISSVIIQ